MSTSTQVPRIAVGGILIECNDFGGQPADLNVFERLTLARGAAMLDLKTSAVGGMLEVLQSNEAQIIPLLFAAAHPAGPMTESTYAMLRSELLDALRRALPVDGVLLPLHGSAAVDGFDDVDDVEGDLASAVRAIAGSDIPVVMTLDLHASVTAAMIRNSDAIMGCETYPHSDYFSTGERAARLILQIHNGDLKPKMVMAKVPVIVGAVHTGTAEEGPFGDMMRRAKAAENRYGIVTTSAFLVHPHLDRPEMGSGVLVVTNGDVDFAEKIAIEATMEYWGRRADIEPSLYTPHAGVQKGLSISGSPVVLVEAADCVGGGASGDSVHTLRALLELAPHESALVPVVDPAAARDCHLAGLGAEVLLELGHSQDPQWGSPLSVAGTVEAISDGKFSYSGGAFHADATMGPSAVFAMGPIRVLITTYGTYDWRDEQYRAVGIEPRDFKFIVAKNPMNHLMTYGDVAAAVIVLNSPGPTPPTCSSLTYKRMKRPFYPFDPEIPGLKPELLRNYWT